MTDLEIYAGEDFALLMSATADDSTTPEQLTDYDVLAQLSTTGLGAKLLASTDNDAQIVIERRGTSTLAVNVSHQLTAKLSEGTVTLTVRLTHRETGIQMIDEIKTINVKRSKLAIL